MMLPLRDEALIINTKVVRSLSNFWLYLTVEFLIGGLLSCLLAVLGIIKSLLPKPPRDLNGDVVLVAGVTSPLGSSLAEEFVLNGCSVICLDNERSLNEISNRLRTLCPVVEEIRPNHRKDEVSLKQNASTYKCDLQDQEDIRRTATRIKDEIGGIDVLVTCVGETDQDIFDTASRTLMSHYWTVLAFLPVLLLRGRAHIVGVTPATSSHDGYLGSRAAIASLMDCLGHELSDRSNDLTFLALSPVIESNSRGRSENQIARDVVQAIRRDQCSLTVSWTSRVLYRISCVIYNAITTVTEWVYKQGCDYSW